jgi:uncharacterized membrane protein
VEITALITTFSCVLFAGAAIYINLVEHPARLECGVELAATVFAPSYRRAAIMQASLAILSTLFALLTWLLGGSWLWLLGSSLIFSVVPLTIIVIMPTNNQLLSDDLDYKSESTRQLLLSWGKLHAMRSVLSLIAACIFLSLLGVR